MHLAESNVTYFWAVLCWYLFVFSIDINSLGADGLADVVDVIFSAVIEDVLILFPESEAEIQTDGERGRNTVSLSTFCVWT